MLKAYTSSESAPYADIMQRVLAYFKILTFHHCHAIGLRVREVSLYNCVSEQRKR